MVAISTQDSAAQPQDGGRLWRTTLGALVVTAFVGVVLILHGHGMSNDSSIAAIRGLSLSLSSNADPVRPLSSIADPVLPTSAPFTPALRVSSSAPTAAAAAESLDDPDLTHAQHRPLGQTSSAASADGHRALSRARWRQTSAVPLMILKNGRAGSTWLRNMLSVAGVTKIDKEIITKTGGPTHGSAEKRRRILRSFSKGAEHLAITGFTACPLTRTAEMQPDFSDVVDAVMESFPRTRILIYSRSNMFRTAIASHGVRHHKPQCKNGKVLQTSFDWENFQCELPHIMQYHRGLLAFGKSLEERGYPVHYVLYEDMKRDTAKTVEGILDFVFEDCDERCRDPKDDKQTILTHNFPYSEYRAPPVAESRFNIKHHDQYLQHFQQLNSSCLVDMLDAVGDPTFDVCPYPFEHETSESCSKRGPTYQCVAVDPDDGHE